VLTPNDRAGASPADGRRSSRPRIVVGVDGSTGARAALVWAMAQAARRGAEVDVLSAVPVETYWADPYLLDARHIDAVRTDTEERVRALVEQVRGDPAVAVVHGSSGVAVNVVVVDGPSAELLVEQAESADLLVVGSRGRSGTRSTLLGSVALHCSTHASAPVVVVHPSSPAPTGGAGTVVVGLDDSDLSRSALRAALAEAGRLGAEVEAVIAYQRLDYWSDLYTLGAPPAGETQEDARRRGEQIVAEVLGEAAEGGGPAVRVVAAEGPAGHVLVRRAEGAALLVVGSRSRSRFTGMVLGSVALHCVVHASVPVMVVHPAAADRPAAPALAPVLG
jgi:nucleotide-binding universal stress UspA family protein